MDDLPAPDGRPDFQAPGMHTVTPYLCVRAAAEAIDWYCEVLGATEVGTRFSDPEGRIGHAEIRIGDSVVMLSDSHPEIGVVAPGADDTTAAYALHLYVADVDAVVAQAGNQGATVEREPQDEFHGARTGAVRDPFGVRWMISTHQRVASEEEHQRAADQYAGKEVTSDDSPSAPSPD